MLHFHLKPISTWPTCPLFSPTKNMAHKCRVFVLPPRDSYPNAPGSDDWCGFKASVRGASRRILPSLSYSHARTKYQSKTWTFLRSDFTSSTPPQQTRRFLRVELHSKQSWCHQKSFHHQQRLRQIQKNVMIHFHQFRKKSKWNLSNIRISLGFWSWCGKNKNRCPRSTEFQQNPPVLQGPILCIEASQLCLHGIHLE